MKNLKTVEPTKIVGGQIYIKVSKDSNGEIRDFQIFTAYGSPRKTPLGMWQIRTEPHFPKNIINRLRYLRFILMGQPRHVALNDDVYRFTPHALSTFNEQRRLHMQKMGW